MSDAGSRTQTAEHQRAGRDHHRIVLRQTQAEDGGAGKGDGGEQDRHLGDDLGAEALDGVEPDNDAGAGEAENARRRASGTSPARAV